MTIYIVLWALVCTAAYITLQYKFRAEYFVWFSFALMAAVLALRGPYVGEDTAMYLEIGERMKQIPWQEVFSSVPTLEWKPDNAMETGYLAYCKLIVTIFRDPQWVLAITAILTSALIAKCILDHSRNEDAIFATYIYMCDSLFMNSFNVMRQILALSFAVQSLQQIKRKNHIGAAVWLLLAVSFHKSAILFLPAAVLYRMKWNKKQYPFFVVGVACLPVMMPLIIKIASLISSKYANYLTGGFWGSQLRGTLLMWAAIVFIIPVIFVAPRTDEFDWYLVYMATTYIAVELVGVRLTLVARAAIYFRVFLVFLFPAAKKYFDAKTRVFYIAAVVVMMTFSYFSYADSPARIYHFFF